MEPVVITGLGAITPIGLTVDDFWHNLKSGVSGVDRISRFDASDLPTTVGAEVRGFDPHAHMDHRLVRRSSRAAQFGVAATYQALRDADLPFGTGAAGSLGVVLNTAFSGGSLLEQGTRDLIAHGPRRISPFLAPMALPSSVACQVAIATAAKGPVLTSVLACASGAYALVEALHFLQRGEATAVIAGGAEASMTRLVVGALANTGAMSRRNDDPPAACRPFDLDRDGFVCGEGAAVMILEKASDARSRGARVYAEVVGGALTCSSHHITDPDPDGDGLRRAMDGALRTASMRSRHVDVVFAHGMGSPLGDVAETRAIKAAFGPDASRLRVTAIKSMIGNTLGAAGAMSALSAVLSIRDGLIPPTINLETPDPECDLDYVPLSARRMPVRSAMVNASGFGGQNVAVLLSACV